MDAQGALEELLAERAISKVLFAYCQGVDRRDWPLVRQCYHDDAVDSHGAFTGTPDELLEFLQRRHAHDVISSTHFLSNVSIRFHESGRLARVESYIYSMQIVDASSGDPFAGQAAGRVNTEIMSRYVDTFELREEGGWRILRRAVVFDWSRRHDLSAFQPVDPSWPLARRDGDDPLYAPWPTLETQSR